MPSLQPVRGSADPLPRLEPPSSLLWPVVIGTLTALLVGFVLLLALWPRTPSPADEIPLVAVSPNDLVIPELVIPAQVDFEPAEEAQDAGVPLAAPKPRPVVKRPPAPKPGKVTVRVNPWAQVSLGGKSLGTTPLPPIEVPAGTATFTLKNDQLGVTRKVSVKVPAGGSVVLKADLFKK
jgi:hypothetical protein